MNGSPNEFKVEEPTPWGIIHGANHCKTTQTEMNETNTLKQTGANRIANITRLAKTGKDR